MIFEVRRTLNGIISEKKPHEKCSEIDWVEVERAPYKSFEEYNEKSGNKLKWTQRGTNHRILENGYIARDREKHKTYTIEINSLEELLDFKNEVGYEIIIGKSEVEGIRYYIEI